MGRREGARRWLRSAFIVASLWAGATCTDTPPVSPKAPLAPGHSRFSVAPRYSRTAENGPVVVLSKVRGLLIGVGGDTTVVEARFQGDSAALTFNVQFTGASASFALVLIGYDLNGIEAYRTQPTQVTLKPGENPSVPPPVLVYSAPDSKLTTLTVAPRGVTLDANTGGAFAVTGTAANNTPISPIRVAWSSTDPAIATVDENGAIHANALHGQTYIVARTVTNLADSALVKVRGVVSRVVTAPALLSLPRGATGAVTAELRDAAGHLIDDRSATFVSSDANVVTVSSTGVVRAIAVGTATITAISADKSGSIPVTVVSPVDRVELTPATVSFASLGETSNVAARIVALPGGSVDGITPSYTSSNPSIATVDANGLITARANGSATITASADGKSGTAAVTVSQVAAAVTVTPAFGGVRALNASWQFSATGVDARGNAVTLPFTWTSSDDAVAAVDATGRATGKGSGTATITASAGGKSASASFTVAQIPSSLTITADRTTIRVGNSATLTARIVDDNGFPVAGGAPAYVSQNTSVATVSGNRVSAVGPGTVVIAGRVGSLTSSISIQVDPASGPGTGGGTVTGTVVNAQNTNAPISGATVTATGSTTSGADGTFMLANVTNGGNTTFSAPGFVGTTYYNVTTSTTSVTSLGSIPLAPVSASPGSYSGRLIDAVTGQGIVGATLSARSGINATSGTVVQTVTTGVNGNFSSSLPAGTYTVSGTATGYIAASGMLVVVGGSSATNQNIVATPVGSGNTIRIVLTWNGQPRDLDSHLLLPGPCIATYDGCHVYYGQPSVLDPSLTTTLGSLDQDVTGGFGPETVTIPSQASGTYRYYVHHYSGSSMISLSGAVVKVYRGSTQIAQFSPPANQGCGGGDVWSVFDLNGTTLTTTNTISCAFSNTVTSARRPSTLVDLIRSAVQGHPKQP